MGWSSSSKRDQLGPESEYYHLTAEVSLPLFKYLLQKVRLPRHLGLCKPQAERGKANTEIHGGWVGGRGPVDALELVGVAPYS